MHALIVMVYLLLNKTFHLNYRCKQLLCPLGNCLNLYLHMYRYIIETNSHVIVRRKFLIYHLYCFGAHTLSISILKSA